MGGWVGGWVGRLYLELVDDVQEGFVGGAARVEAGEELPFGKHELEGLPQSTIDVHYGPVGVSGWVSGWWSGSLASE